MKKNNIIHILRWKAVKIPNVVVGKRIKFDSTKVNFDNTKRRLSEL